LSKAWIYCRVSSKEQAINGMSLTSQFEECRKHVDFKGLQLGSESNYDNPGVFSDPGVSAWKVPIFERPGFKELWRVAKPNDNIVTLSLDRAFRSVMDFTHSWERFESTKIMPIFVRDNVDMSTATGKFMAHIAAAFAQFKSDLISQRTREAFAYRRENKLAEGRVKQKKIRPADNHALAMLHAKASPSELEAAVNDTGRVFGYVRVSTDQQEIEAQHSIVERCMGHMAEDGFQPSTIHVDHGVSAFTKDWKDRAAGKMLWDEMREGDCIVVLRIDRIFRSIRDMAVTTKELLSRGVHLVTSCGIDTRSMAGRQAIEIMAMMAEWESRDIGWRAKLGVQQAAKTRGKWTGRATVPRYMDIVYDKEGEWSVKPNLKLINEFREVQELHELGMSYPEVSDCFEERLAAREGRPMTPPTPFRHNVFSRNKTRQGISKSQKKAMRKWFRENKRHMFRGEYIRSWSWLRVRGSLKLAHEYDEILQAYDIAEPNRLNRSTSQLTAAG